jgi:hypothetical protein
MLVMRRLNAPLKLGPYLALRSIYPPPSLPMMNMLEIVFAMIENESGRCWLCGGYRKALRCFEYPPLMVQFTSVAQMLNVLMIENWLILSIKQRWAECFRQTRKLSSLANSNSVVTTSLVCPYTSPLMYPASLNTSQNPTLYTVVF